MGQEYIREQLVIGNIPGFSRVLLYEPFDSLVNFTLSGTGTPTSKLLISKFFSGSKSLYVQSRTATPAEDDTAQIANNAFLGVSNKVQISVIFSLVDISAFKYFHILASYLDGTNLHNIGIRYYLTDTTWQYITTDGTWSDISGSSQLLGDATWYRCIFSFNLLLKSYSSFCCGNLDVDISSLFYQTSANASAQSFKHTIKSQNAGAAAVDFYIDSILITED